MIIILLLIFGILLVFVLRLYSVIIIVITLHDALNDIIIVVVHEYIL